MNNTKNGIALHRKDTPYVWWFEWDEYLHRYIHKSRKYTYTIETSSTGGFCIGRYEEIGYGELVDANSFAKPKELEFMDGGRYIFPRR